MAQDEAAGGAMTKYFGCANNVWVIRLAVESIAIHKASALG